MASNTLKDLNTLPATDKMNECKASLAKPCVGKTNGKSEDRPLPSSAALDPTSAVETEKATVEVEYIESENLDNVDDADALLKVFFLSCLCFCVLVCIKSINCLFFSFFRRL